MPVQLQEVPASDAHGRAADTAEMNVAWCGHGRITRRLKQISSCGSSPARSSASTPSVSVTLPRETYGRCASPIRWDHRSR